MLPESCPNFRNEDPEKAEPQEPPDSPLRTPIRKPDGIPDPGRTPGLTPELVASESSEDEQIVKYPQQIIQDGFIQDGFAIVICSAGRPKDLANTLKLLEPERRTLFGRILVQVDPNEACINEYRDVSTRFKIRLVDGVRGLPGQRKRAWANHNFSHTLFVDDDITRIVWPFGGVLDLACTLKQAMQDNCCMLGGVAASQRPNPDAGKAPKLSTKLGLVSGYFYMESRAAGISSLVINWLSLRNWL